MPVNCDNGHDIFDVGWGKQCGVCGMALISADTDQRLRKALIYSGIKLYDLPPPAKPKHPEPDKASTPPGNWTETG